MQVVFNEISKTCTFSITDKTFTGLDCVLWQILPVSLDCPLWTLFCNVFLFVIYTLMINIFVLSRQTVWKKIISDGHTGYIRLRCHNFYGYLFIRPSRDGPYYVIGYGGWAGVHTGFHTITLVLYIGSVPNLVTWFPCGRGRTLFILGSLGQKSRSLLL
jgi:hypothetical protein